VRATYPEHAGPPGQAAKVFVLNAWRSTNGRADVAKGGDAVDVKQEQRQRGLVGLGCLNVATAAPVATRFQRHVRCVHGKQTLRTGQRTTQQHTTQHAM